MFEISGRHKAMFAMSDIRHCADAFTSALHLDELSTLKPKIKVVDISQTVCLNENNAFVVQSELGYDEVLAAFAQHRSIKHLENSANAPCYIEKFLAALTMRLGIDSCFCMGRELLAPEIGNILPSATGRSRKPLIIFNACEAFSFQADNQKWLDQDLPALWVGQKDWKAGMEGVEAFFAISPAFKLETSLNRYQALGSFQDFSVGMVKL